jgi:hypothetical protein
MADAIVFFDPAAPPGAKFPSPNVRTELQLLSPSTIGAKEVTEPKLDKLAPGTLTGDTAGIGILTIVNSAGDPISLRGQIVTTAEYNALSPDPGTLYLITP